MFQQPTPEDQTPSTPQQPLPPVYVSIRELSEQRHRYNIDPSFQRKKAWTIVMAQAFIDSLLRGDPTPPLEGYEEYNEKGEKTTVIIDGHQRTETVLNFVDNLFRTWTIGEKRQAEPGSEPPVEPRKYADNLSPIARNHLLDYHFQINRIRKTSDEQIRTRFLRVQNHMPLSAAEKLNAYKSKALEAARRIEQHPFWENSYEGKTNREQTFQSSLHILAMELAPDGIVGVNSAASLQTLASGKRDQEITESLIEAALDRLTVVAHAYHGLHFTVRAACLAMYQSVMYIEQTGYAIQASDKGRLTPWMDGLLSASRRSGLPGYDRPITMLTHKSAQRAFWAKHRKSVMALFGIEEAA